MAPLAEPVILQLDLAQTIALAGSLGAGIPTAAWAAAKVFTNYLAAKDKVQNERIVVRDEQTRELAEAFKQVAATVQETTEKGRVTQEQIAAAARGENRQTVDNLIGLNREVVAATGAVNQKVGEVAAVVASLQANIGAGVTELKGEVRNLSETVGQLGAVMGQLGRGVEDLKDQIRGGADGGRPAAAAAPEKPKERREGNR